MASVKTIRALERGLDVLESFQIHPTCTLQDIHRTTQIPKPTLLRILETLQRAGVVTRRLGDGRCDADGTGQRRIPRQAVQLIATSREQAVSALMSRRSLFPPEDMRWRLKCESWRLSVSTWRRISFSSFPQQALVT